MTKRKKDPNGLLAGLSVMIDGGFHTEAEILDELPELVVAQCYTYTDGKMRLSGVEPAPARDDDPPEVVALAERLTDGHFERKAVWEDENSKGASVRDAFAALARSVLEHVRTVSAKRRKVEAKWKGKSTNDRIDKAFAELNAKGIVALQAAGYTMSDGWSDVNHIASSRQPVPKGATFYHGQDLERGVAGRGLMLAFGAYEEDDAKHDAKSLAVAKTIRTVLKKHGVKTEWNGSIDERISIPPFKWRKRRP